MTMFSIFEVIAAACERLNEFAILIRNSQNFLDVRTGTDLRYYNSGWKFEKYVEAKISDVQGYTAVWWLDISEDNVKWRIYSNTSISYGDYDEDLKAVVVESNALEDKLNQVVDMIISSYDEGHEFKKEINRIQNSLSD